MNDSFVAVYLPFANLENSLELLLFRGIAKSEAADFDPP
jgi:hypothetical protein